ncbi:MAG TPA: peptide deformylase [Verrucomicrobiae bacterium]|nr:peptide deformylase [Verrucomicrobiae bacterium]
MTIKGDDRIETQARRQALRKLSLRLYPDSVLRQPCTPVEWFDSTLRDLLAEMRSLMLANGGIGLAGPQVGLTQQLFIGEIDGRHLALINPVLQPGAETEAMIEGCLSLPGTRVNVRRPARVSIAGFDPDGKRFTREVDGLCARVIQHETDHLHGVLILDHGPRLDEGTIHERNSY